MSYQEKSISSNVNQRDKVRLALLSDVIKLSSSAEAKFYEFEPAVVLDVIVNDSHPIFNQKKGIAPKIDIEEHPGNPKVGDVDYSWIGRVLVRMVNSQRGRGQEVLTWAIPMDHSLELPLKNEIVYVTKYFEQLYYKKLNTRNFVNNNVDFRYEKKYGLNDGLNAIGPESYTRSKDLPDPNKNYRGAVGDYFITNDNIRHIRKNEGDTVLESRFGQSIRFNGFVGNKIIDSAGVYNSYPSGSGNPCLFIRNRQRDLDIKTFPNEKNVGSNIMEDINHDGSSLQMTSGKYISDWDKDTVLIKPFEVNSLENARFSPTGSTEFIYPELSGDQIVMQSDRIILSARKNEFFLCSKYRFSTFTDSEYTVDADGQIVMTSNTHFHINSPYIFLGDYGAFDQPIMLGTVTTKWLYDLIEWLKTHTHIYKHTHPGSGQPSPNKTQVTPELQELLRLQSLIPELVSDRVFTSSRNRGTGTLVSQTSNPPITKSKIAYYKGN